MKNKLLALYKKLLKQHGKQHWWPVSSLNPEFEICLGAILTQNTNWNNVTKALHNLNQNNLLNPNTLIKTSHKTLASLIRPSGYYNQKANRLKIFTKFYLTEFKKLRNLPLKESRQRLLTIHGIGKETADSILLYALNKPIFVIDTYTKRTLEREFNISFKEYDAYQQFFHNNLPRNTNLFKEFHALLVTHEKKDSSRTKGNN